MPGFDMFNCLGWADSTPGSGGSGGCGSDRFRYARCQEVRTAQEQAALAGHARLQDGRRHGSLTIMRPLRAIIAAFGNFARSHAAVNHASHARAPTRDGPARRERGESERGRQLQSLSCAITGLIAEIEISLKVRRPCPCRKSSPVLSSPNFPPPHVLSRQVKYRRSPVVSALLLTFFFAPHPTPRRTELTEVDYLSSQSDVSTTSARSAITPAPAPLHKHPARSRPSLPPSPSLCGLPWTIRTA